MAPRPRSPWIAEQLQSLARPLEDLALLPGNPNVGDAVAVARSLDRFGQRKNIVAQLAGHIVEAGNTTLSAARLLATTPALRVHHPEWEWTQLAVVVCDDDDSVAKAFAITDNRTADLGREDRDALAAMVAEVRAADEALLAAASFTEKDLLALLGFDSAGAFEEPDAVPSRPPLARTVRGDVWLLGPHRVMCGDATVPTDVERLLAGSPADLVWTDPPYGVGYHRAIANDDLELGELERLLRAAFVNVQTHTRPGACWYVAAPAGPQFLAFAAPLAELGVWHQTISWVKDSLVLGRADYHGRHEVIFYGWAAGEPERPPGMVLPDELLSGEHYDEAFDAVLYGWTPGAAHTRPPNRKQDTVWEIPRPKASKEHPTMKPVALIERAVRNSTGAGDLVLDVFGGSGSTLVAAHQCGRRAFVLELDPLYVDVICRRWQDGTGVLPIAEATGREHDFTKERAHGSPRSEADTAGAADRPRRNQAQQGRPPKRAARSRADRPA